MGILLLVAAFASLILSSRLSPPPAPAPEVESPAPMPGAPNQAPSVADSARPASSPADATFAALASVNADAVVTTLRNDHVELRLTNYGGAIRDVAFARYPAEQDSDQAYIFNQINADPILAFAERSIPGLGRNTPYQLVSATASEVVYRTVLEGRLEITRRYALPGPDEDPYRIHAATTFRNLADHPVPAVRAALALGTTAHVSVNDYGQYLNVATYDGDDADVIAPGDLEGGGFLSWIGLKDGAPKTVLEQDATTVWAAVKNQFFVSIYTPATPGNGVIVRRVELEPFPGTTKPNGGITGAIRLDVPALEAGGSATIAGDLYVGPKEYTRLAQFEKREDKVMQYDRYFFSKIALSGVLAPTMNRLMNWMHGFVGNWGVAIILMTLALKIVTLPFTLAASKSAKRMAKFQPEIAAIREKFKDNPQKMNQATLELFKKHKINPAGGCLPVLITIPLFIAFFAMLQGTAELRFQSFLWAHDLSAPDTIARIFGLPINIMPLLMGATMIIQMRLTPSPSVDNAQMKMMKFMPIIFTLFCYNFAAALALYSTINGVFTIGQQLIVNRMKDPATDNQVVDPAAAVASVGGKGKGRKLKNVTPKK
ncbi:MAG: membrane protein insertase YidC [Verrucomicrobiota bacterium]